jgi:hypothetical protein
VTEFPELQHALVVAGRRRYGRAPRARRLTRVVLVAAAVCAAVVLVVAITRAPGEQERTAAPARDVAHDYAVFRRAPTKADEPSSAVTGMPGLRVDEARLAERSGPWRLYLVAGALDGREAVCVFAVVGDRARFGCDDAGSVQGYGFRPVDGDPGGVVAVVPDGVDEVAVGFDGEAFTAPVHDNAALVRLSPWPRGDGTIAWTDAAGAHQQAPLKTGPEPGP